MTTFRGNFAHLKAYDEELVRLGLLAERYFAEDPNTSLLKLRQLTELLAQHVAGRIGLMSRQRNLSTNSFAACGIRVSSRLKLPNYSVKSGGSATPQVMAWRATTGRRLGR